MDCHISLYQLPETNSILKTGDD